MGKLLLRHQYHMGKGSQEDRLYLRTQLNDALIESYAAYCRISPLTTPPFGAVNLRFCLGLG